MIIGTNYWTNTDETGKYKLQLPAKRRMYVKYSYLGNFRKFKVGPFTPERKVELNVLLDNRVNLKTVDIKSQSGREREIAPMVPIYTRTLNVLPMASSSKVSAIIKTLPGVSSNTELSSNYSVRGGNYEEVPASNNNSRIRMLISGMCRDVCSD